MYKYVYDISKLSHNIIKEYCSRFNTAIDATLGNGHDCEFLSDNFKKVIAFDVQEEAIEICKTKSFNNVDFILDSHEFIDNYVENADCIIYNLGFLPGGDKTLTTKVNSSLMSIQKALSIVNSGGLISIAVYEGHEEGKREKVALMNLLSSLDKKEFGVMHHVIINRINPPSLFIIEKK